MFCERSAPSAVAQRVFEVLHVSRQAPFGVAGLVCTGNAAYRSWSSHACGFAHYHNDNSSSHYHSFTHLSEPLPNVSN